MSFDDPKAYHREWKAKHDDNANAAIGCLAVPVLLVPGIAVPVLGTGAFLVFGRGFGFWILIALVVIAVLWAFLNDRDSSNDRGKQKLRQLALRSLESNVCPNCGEYAFPEQRGDDGWWRCTSCSVEISPQGNAQFRGSPAEA